MVEKLYIYLFILKKIKDYTKIRKNFFIIFYFLILIAITASDIMSYIISLNAFSYFFNKIELNKITNHHTGSFKKKNSTNIQHLEKLNEIVKLENLDDFNCENLWDFYFKALTAEKDNGYVIDHLQLSLTSVNFLKRLINNNSIFNSTQLDELKYIFQLTVESNNEIVAPSQLTQTNVNQVNRNQPSQGIHIINDTIENTQANSDTLTSQDMVEMLSSLNSNDSNDKQLLTLLLREIKKIQDNQNNISKTIHSEIANNFSTHLGVNVKLTTFEKNKMISRLSFTCNKIHRKKLRLRIYDTHLQNETAPDQLNYDLFPEPLSGFDQSVINEYNELISNFQRDIMNFWSKITKEQIKKDEEDIEVFKEKLSGQVEDIDQLIRDIYDKEESKLSKTFEKSIAKCNAMKNKMNMYSSTLAPRNKQVKHRRNTKNKFTNNYRNNKSDTNRLNESKTDQSYITVDSNSDADVNNRTPFSNNSKNKKKYNNNNNNINNNRRDNYNKYRNKKADRNMPTRHFRQFNNNYSRQDNNYQYNNIYNDSHNKEKKTYNKVSDKNYRKRNYYNYNKSNQSHHNNNQNRSNWNVNYNQSKKDFRNRNNRDTTK